MNALIQRFNQMVDAPEMAKLILRVGFAFLFLLHGVHKIYGGTEFIQGKFVEFALPAFLAYLVYVGEVIAPLLIIVGVWTRLSAFIGVMTCVIVIWLMHIDHLFTLAKTGAWIAEGAATFLIGFLAVMLLGSGKYALKAD